MWTRPRVASRYLPLESNRSAILLLPRIVAFSIMRNPPDANAPTSDPDPDACVPGLLRLLRYVYGRPRERGLGHARAECQHSRISIPTSRGISRSMATCLWCRRHTSVVPSESPPSASLYASKYRGREIPRDSVQSPDSGVGTRQPPARIQDPLVDRSGPEFKAP